MALPEYVVPIVGVVSVPALIIAVTHRSFIVARAVMLLLAGITAIVTAPKGNRSEVCRGIIKEIMGGGDDDPPQLD